MRCQPAAKPDLTLESAAQPPDPTLVAMLDRLRDAAQAHDHDHDQDQ